MTEQIGIITKEDLKEVEEANGSVSDDAFIDDFVMVIAFIILIGVIVTLVRSLKKKRVLTYIDEDGKEHSVSLDFTAEDLEEVYKELDKMPLEE